MIAEDEARTWLETLPEFDAAAAERLDGFALRLALENAQQNLVSRESMGALWSRHIVDSAQLLGGVPRETRVWLDLGTGAGFPGLIIAILRPDMQVRLVESRARRADWLRHETQALDLRNVSVIESRLEAVRTDPVDVISARAFAPLDRLLALAARFATMQTIWRLPKGRSARDELASLRGWAHTFHVEQSLTDPNAGIITGTLLGAEEKRA